MRYFKLLQEGTWEWLGYVEVTIVDSQRNEKNRFNDD